jgi:hypothetical protein
MLGAWFLDVMANWCRSSWLGLGSYASPTDKVNDELCDDKRSKYEPIGAQEKYN